MEDWELIAIDDHSTDDSFALLSKFSFNDKRIKCFHNTGEGIIDALDTGFKHSIGEYISRMDADDIMPQMKLSKLLELCEDYDKVIASGKVKYFSNKEISEGYEKYENWLNEMSTDKELKKNLYRECVIASPNWMVHRSCFESDIPMNQLIYPEDYDLVFKWVQLGYRFEMHDSVTHMWREHPERTSRNSERYQQASFFHLKTNRFIEYELDNNEEVQLVGAGVKGKLVADILDENQINFRWYDLKADNKSSNILDVNLLDSNHKTIMTVWPDGDKVQDEITSFLESKGLFFGENVWLF